MTDSVGFIALARPTFDIAYAEEIAREGLETLEKTIDNVIGEAVLTIDLDTATQRAAAFSNEQVDAVVVMQATFADSTLITAVADAIDCPIVLWAVPEERRRYWCG